MSEPTPSAMFQSNKVYIRVDPELLAEGAMVTDVAWSDDFDLGPACELGDTECESCS